MENFQLLSRESTFYTYFLAGYKKSIVAVYSKEEELGTVHGSAV